MAAGEGGELDAREADRMAGERLELAGGPARQFAELGEEGVLADLGLVERALVEGGPAGVPAPLAVDLDRAVLDLDDEDAAVGVDDHEVGLAVAGGPVLARPADPPGVRVEAPAARLRESGPQSLDDDPLGRRAAGEGCGGGGSGGPGGLVRLGARVGLGGVAHVPVNLPAHRSWSVIAR